MRRKIKTILHNKTDEIENHKATKEQKKLAKDLLKNNELRKTVHDPTKPGLI